MFNHPRWNPIFISYITHILAWNAFLVCSFLFGSSSTVWISTFVSSLHDTYRLLIWLLCSLLPVSPSLGQFARLCQAKLWNCFDLVFTFLPTTWIQINSFIRFLKMLFNCGRSWLACGTRSLTRDQIQAPVLGDGVFSHWTNRLVPHQILWCSECTVLGWLEEFSNTHWNSLSFIRIDKTVTKHPSVRR